MKRTSIQHGLYKNLPGATIYNSQAAAIVFALGIAFKISAAPELLSEFYGSSTMLAYTLLTLLDIISVVASFAFTRMRGDELLRTTNNKAYKLCCGLASLWLIVKGTFYFCFCAAYLTRELFGGIVPSIVYLLLLAPIIYVGAKGARSISRTCEIFVPVFFAFILFNLVFLDTDIDVERNLPLFAVEPEVFFENLFRYGIWMGDALPFVFLRIKNKRLPYLSTGIVTTFALINIIVFLGVSIYGDALKTVSDLGIHIAIFNRLSTEIGRVEWTNLFAVVALSILSISFIFFGSMAACERATGFPLPAKITFPLIACIVSLTARSSQEISEFAIESIGYVMCALAIGLPVMMLGIFAFAKHKQNGIYVCLDDEYLPHPPLRPDTPNSLADNVLSGLKEEAENTHATLDNGSLVPIASEEGNQ